MQRQKNRIEAGISDIKKTNFFNSTFICRINRLPENLSLYIQYSCIFALYTEGSVSTANVSTKIL